MNNATGGVKVSATARKRTPIIKIRHRVGLLNQSAIALLAQDGERFICICRSLDGEISLKPIELPEGALAVRPLFMPEQGGQPRISTGDLEPGNYELIWRGDIEAAVLQKVA